jgi:hypothetical protein
MVRSSFTVKDGNVIVNGTVVGRVEKTTEGTSFGALVSNRPGPVRWVPKDLSGRVIVPPLRTRREAAQIVVEYTTPDYVDGLKIERSWGEDRYTAFVFIEGNAFGVWRLTSGGKWRINYIRSLGTFMPRYSTIPVEGYELDSDRFSNAIELLDEAVRKFSE